MTPSETTSKTTKRRTSTRRSSASKTKSKTPKASSFKTLMVPVVPMRGMVAFPSMVMPLFIGREKSVAAIESVAGENIVSKMLLLVAQREEDIEEPSPQDLHPVGTLAEVMQMLKMPDGNVRVVVEGRSRAKIIDWQQDEPFFEAKVEILEDAETPDTPIAQALMRRLKAGFEQAVEMSKTTPPEAVQNAGSLKELGGLADLVASYLDIAPEERQAVLEMTEPLARAHRVAELLTRELQVLEIDRELDSQVREGVNESQREYFLRERLKAIQEKLGERDSSFKEADTLRARVEEAKMPPEARDKALSEIDRLEKMPPIAPEAGTIRTYVEWMCDLPWDKCTPDNLDIARAQQVLDEDHDALDKIKDRIVEFLAVRKLNPQSRGPILCFAGPPGVGKTSLGKSIARALGREFIRVSVGGIHDEAEIRGHRRTYIGSMPGRIISAIKRAKVKNPVFMLDELDKLGHDYRGDPSSALLEALDPEQNTAFSDHYLEVPFDLSEVMFVATANLLDTIPAALRDRLEVLRFAGYTESEKKSIACRFLIPKQTLENGLTPEAISFADAGVTALIRDYTREAGVRNLEREIGTVCRKVARRVAEQGSGEVATPKRKRAATKKTISKATLISPESLPEYLGARKFQSGLANEKDEIGVAQGLAYTEAGGELMPIEVTLVAGKGNVKLTGNLGDIMKESCEAAMTYARSHAEPLGISGDWTTTHDAHIHVPSGAVPKDGPSAGVAIAVALVSAMTNCAVRKDVAMSGEISLRGRVLPVGGIKEKVLAAHRAGAHEILLPKENARDVDELPSEVRNELQFHWLERLDEAMVLALVAPQSKKPRRAPRATKASV